MAAFPLVLAAPALAGLPAIASGIFYFVGKDAAKLFFKRVLFFGFLIILFSLITDFIGFIVAWVYALDTPIPSVVGEVFFWFLPENTLTILATIYAAKIARLAYDLKVKVLTTHLAVYTR